VRPRARWQLLAALLLAACWSGDGGGSAALAAPAARTLAVRLADADPALEREIRAGSFFRWASPAASGWRVEVGNRAAGEIEVLVDRLPAETATLRRLTGLPVDLEMGAFVFAGTSYDPARHTLALRLPEPRHTTWVLLGGTNGSLAELTNDLLFQLTGGRGSADASPDFDYLLRETRWLERRGRWRAVTPPLRPRGRVESEGGLQRGEKLRPWWRVGWRGRFARGERRWEVDPLSERDDLAARDRFYAGLVTLPGTSAVVLRAPAALAARPEIARLAAALDGAAAAMARRVPLELAAPVSLTVESDFVAQGRHIGSIGEAVLGPRADLHLVFHPDDLHAYESAVAAVLLRRAGLADRLPVWLARGAALWLAGDWYGRPWRDWLPALAAAGALPTADELLAVEAQRDSSAPLWTPAAAAVVAALPGATLREKLAVPPPRERVEAALAALARLPPPATGASGSLPSPFLAGISLAMSNGLDEGYHAPSLERTLDAVQGLGANAVSLMPFAFQRGAASPDLGFLHKSPSGETDVGLIHAARRCRARGISVLWKPHIWVSHESWPGEIEMRSEEDWARWWRGYRRYVLHHAFLARWAEADLFAVGVELSRTLGRAEEWRRLIDDVRRLYPGPLTYAGNWDPDLDRTPFWDRLDLLGVDAYFPLATSPTATPAELAAGATRVRDRLAATAAQHGKPLLLTEVGFAARRGAWVTPHVEGGELSVEDQARAYEALFAGLGRPSWLAGTYVWKLHSGPRRRGGEPGADFEVLGRPAEAVVRAYYAR
jgi:hypothetical protein